MGYAVWEAGAMGRRQAILAIATGPDERRARPPRFPSYNAPRHAAGISQGWAHLVVSGLGRRPTASLSPNMDLLTSLKWEGEGDELTSLSDSAASRACRRTPLCARGVINARWECAYEVVGGVHRHNRPKAPTDTFRPLVNGSERATTVTGQFAPASAALQLEGRGRHVCATSGLDWG